MTTSQMMLMSGARPVDPSFASVTLLMEAAAGGAVDLSNNAWTVTANSGATTTAAQAQFSLSFDFTAGNRRYTFSGSGAALALAGQFTIECWIYMSSLLGFAIMASKDAEAAGGFSWYVLGTGALRLDKQTTQVIASTSTVGAAGWHHIACTRDGSNVIRQFIDGTVDATTATDATNFTGDTTAFFGSSSTFGTGTYYMDQCRVTIGVCRYTASFTAPTSPFPTQ